MPHNATTPNARQRVLLFVFACFSVVAFAVAILMLAIPTFGRIVVPYYGWPIIGFFYASALKYTLPAFLKANPIPVTEYFRSIIRILAISMVFGLFMIVLSWISGNFDNPYLTVASWQPVWTILVPAIWITLFVVFRPAPEHLQNGG